MFSVAALSYPNIDPVLIEIGPLAVRWYALAYIAGVVLGYFYIKKLNAKNTAPLMTPKQLEDLMFWAIVGIMLGGRLGYAFFYNTQYYLSHPLEILAIWQGGMSFHGGLLGVIVAFYWFARRQNIPYLRLMDVVACAAPLGLLFGRLANFINGELFGRISDVPWAMVFPHGGPMPRHPSQLYEAALEGLLLFVLLLLLVTKTNAQRYAGLLSGVFLMGYGLSRAFVEYFREPDEQLGFIFSIVTMGQLLCLPMVVVGLYLMMSSKKRYV